MNLSAAQSPDALLQTKSITTSTGAGARTGAGDNGDRRHE